VRATGSRRRALVVLAIGMSPAADGAPPLASDPETTTISRTPEAFVMSTRRGLGALPPIVATALLAGGIAIAQPAGAPARSSATAAHAAGSQHHFRGRVITADRRHRWFRMDTSTNRTLRIYTTDRTSWHGCDWDDMHNGYDIDVRAHRSQGHWVASRMATWQHHGDHDDHHGDRDDHHRDRDEHHDMR
jgi:hypothetical protein